MTITNIVPKYNRCIEFRMTDGSTITVKVQGDKDAAAAAAKSLVNMLTNHSTLPLTAQNVKTTVIAAEGK
jgi:hypothetical protein